MKVAALIVGLIGALLTAGLGIKWVADYEKNKESIESLTKMIGKADSPIVADAIKEVDKTRRAGYAMAVLGLAALAAAAAVFKFAKPSGAIMIAASLVPAVMLPSTLVVTFLLLIAGGLALAAKRRTA